jgi:hypothetical protein
MFILSIIYIYIKDDTELNKIVSLAEIVILYINDVKLFSKTVKCQNVNLRQRVTGKTFLKTKTVHKFFLRDLVFTHTLIIILY